MSSTTSTMTTTLPRPLQRRHNEHTVELTESYFFFVFCYFFNSITAISKTASLVAPRSTDEADPSLAAHMTGNTTLSKQHVAQKPEEERKLQHTLPEEEVQEELLEAKAAAKEEEEDMQISTQQEEQAAEVHTLFHFSVLL